MVMTEEQKIEFIISKIDIYLEELEEGDIKEALDIIISNYVTDDERKTFISYFYKLYKGYTKYKVINPLIDYHKNFEKITAGIIGSKHIVNKSKKHSDETVTVDLVNEILDIDSINTNEMIKLKVFFSKLIISLFSIAIVMYLIFMIIIIKDPSDIIVGSIKILQ